MSYSKFFTKFFELSHLYLNLIVEHLFKAVQPKKHLSKFFFGAKTQFDKIQCERLLLHLITFAVK